jgi:spermidine synthase
MTQENNLGRLMNGWFSETSDVWPGIALSIEIEKTLFAKKSQFQQIELFETRHHGRMLVLDGVIQLTDFDEFAYQEMLAHTPLFAHPDPEKVLVIGGGDGGVLREIARHERVQTIDICEIDEAVIQVSRQYLPEMGCGFDDPRVTIHIADGNEFIGHHPDEYDVIIVDSSDPVGPGEILFEGPFYENCRRALKKNGILAVQGESFFLHPDLVQKMVKCMKDLFKIHAYSTFLVPTFTGGHIGICLGSKGPAVRIPGRKIPEKIQERLKYYTARVHEASFVLPKFAEKLIEEGRFI